MVLSGLSAGAICWFDQAISDAVGEGDDTSDYQVLEGLGWLSGVCCPHAVTEPNRQDFIEREIPSEVLMIDDDAAVHVMPNGASNIVSVSVDYGAFYV